MRFIKVKEKRSDDYGIRVNNLDLGLTKYERAVSLLRYLDKKQFKSAVRTAKFYRMADRTLEAGK